MFSVFGKISHRVANFYLHIFFVMINCTKFSVFFFFFVYIINDILIDEFSVNSFTGVQIDKARENFSLKNCVTNTYIINCSYIIEHIIYM